jgi:hypothetical protein
MTVSEALEQLRNYPGKLPVFCNGKRCFSTWFNGRPDVQTVGLGFDDGLDCENAFSLNDVRVTLGGFNPCGPDAEIFAQFSAEDEDTSCVPITSIEGGFYDGDLCIEVHIANEIISGSGDTHPMLAGKPEPLEATGAILTSKPDRHMDIPNPIVTVLTINTPDANLGEPLIPTQPTEAELRAIQRLIVAFGPLKVRVYANHPEATQGPHIVTVKPNDESRIYIDRAIVHGFGMYIETDKTADVYKELLTRADEFAADRILVGRCEESPIPYGRVRSNISLTNF